MAHDPAQLLGRHGVARTGDLAGRVDRHTLARWVRHGRLLRPFPGVVADPEAFRDWGTRALAAVLATDGVVSHSSALALWRLHPGVGAVHVSVPASRRALRRPGLLVHRAVVTSPELLGGLPVTPLPRSLVDAWGWAHSARGPRGSVETAREAVITALRDRRLPVASLDAEVGTRPALPGRRALVELLGLVAQGCESELEIWGVREVLTGPGMPRFVQQHRVVTPSGPVRLDASVPELKVAIELDGAAFHGSAAQRERDTRRDVALAALGWVVLRFSYRRLTREPEACRREILAVCRARATQLG